MSKTLKILSVILVCVLLLSVTAGLILNWVAFSRLADTTGLLGQLQASQTGLQEKLGGVEKSLNTLHEDYEKSLQPESPEDLTKENDVTIANEYVIRSTESISDAYRSGNRSALSDKEKETLDMASGILESILVDNMTEYDKEKAVYDWMTKNLARDHGLLTVIPSTQADCDNPYGVLKYHNAVCVGYATTFRLFMQMMGIPCKVVHNSECYHSWDLVQLDGGWYHTDIYSDVGNGNYSHFNLTDTMMGENQNWDTNFFPPANRYDYCYACKDAVTEEDIYHVPTALREAIDAHGNLLSLQFDGTLQEYQAQIVQQMLNDIQNRLNNSSDYNDFYMNWSWIPNDKGYVLAVNLTWYNSDDPEPEIPDDAYQKMYDAVEDAFGDVDYYYYSDSDAVG